MAAFEIDRERFLSCVEEFLTGFMKCRSKDSQKENCAYCCRAFGSIPGLHMTRKVPGEAAGECSLEFAWSGLGEEKPVILHAWMDDVPEPAEKANPPLISDGSIRGSGALAGKGGAAILYGLMKEISRKPVRFPFELRIQLTLGHRRGGAGCAALAAQTDGQAALLMEPTAGKIMTRHAGSLWLKLTSRGIACHTSVQQFGAGRDALTSLFELLDRMEEKYRTWAETADPVYPYRFNVGTFSAGVWPSALCPKAEAGVAVILDDSESAEQLKAELIHLAGDFGVEAEVLRDWGGGGQKDLPAVFDKLPACLQHHGFSGETGVSPEALELGIYQKTAGIPCVAFGPGDPGIVGTAEEAVSEKALSDTAQVILDWLESSPGSIA